MTQITAKMVNDLRERSGAPMMQCKQALTTANGDVDKAFDELRKAGLKQADKKAGNEMGEGRLAALVAADGKSGALVALTCQTDFVAKGDEFQALVAEAAKLGLEQAPADVDALNKLKHSKTGVELGETVKLFVGKSGENTSIAKFQRFANKAGVVGSYVHHDAKKGALVSVTCSADAATAAPFLKQLCMHIVSAMPIPVANTRAEIPAAEVERERAVLLELPDLKGKAPELQEKILKGRIEKFFAERVLSEQAWMLDDKLTVQKAVEAALGKGAVIAGFARFQIGK